jgi:transcriptional regulator with XRE-family HTH domain
MTDKERLEAMMSDIPAATTRHVRKSIDIADRISMLLETQGKTQKDLASALRKSESEISKWLGGQHNFTIRTLATIEDALGENILTVPGGKRHEKYYAGNAVLGNLGEQISAGANALVAHLSDLEWNIEDQSLQKRTLPQSTKRYQMTASNKDQFYTIVA